VRSRGGDPGKGRKRDDQPDFGGGGGTILWKRTTNVDVLPLAIKEATKGNNSKGKKRKEKKSKRSAFPRKFRSVVRMVRGALRS